MTETIEKLARPAWHIPHAGIRMDAYALLAALLTDTPSRGLIGIIQNLHWDEDIPQRMQKVLGDVQDASTALSVDQISDEFQRLFVGLGSGELIPYGSWYREKLIQSAPLAAIRTDLLHLGIVRKPDAFESEDHAGALCEIMALLSNPASEIAEEEQVSFFENHIHPWMLDFFADLKNVGDAEFYRTVGEFGLCFLENEKVYLQFAENS